MLFPRFRRLWSTEEEGYRNSRGKDGFLEARRALGFHAQDRTVLLEPALHLGLTDLKCIRYVLIGMTSLTAKKGRMSPKRYRATWLHYASGF